jgi:hypothetical protein
VKAHFLGKNPCKCRGAEARPTLRLDTTTNNTTTETLYRVYKHHELRSIHARRDDMTLPLTCHREQRNPGSKHALSSSILQTLHLDLHNGSAIQAASPPTRSHSQKHRLVSHEPLSCAPHSHLPHRLPNPLLRPPKPHPLCHLRTKGLCNSTSCCQTTRLDIPFEQPWREEAESRVEQGILQELV